MSIELTDAEHAVMDIKLMNFCGLEYDTEESVEFEIKVTTLDNFHISSDYSRINPYGKYLEINYKIIIDTKNDDDMFALFLNPIILTLIKHSSGNSSEIAFCGVDVSQLYAKDARHMKLSKRFTSDSKIRSVSFDMEISLTHPLSDYENVLIFTLHSVHNVADLNTFEIGINVPYRREIDKSVTFQVNLNNRNSTCHMQRKQWLSLAHLPGTVSYSSEEFIPFETMHEPAVCKSSVNGFFKSMIATKEACRAFYDHIRASNDLIIEIILNGTEHFFGLIDCEELLHVGEKSIRLAIPLYKFNLDLFEKYSCAESLFHKKGIGKTKKSSRKINNILPQTLDGIQAIDENCNKIFITVEMELERPLNPEIDAIHACPQIAQSSFFDESMVINLRKKLLHDVDCMLQKYRTNDMGKLIDMGNKNGNFEVIENFILTNIEKLRTQISQPDDECYLSSKILSLNSNENNVCPPKIYEAIGEFDLYEHELLQIIFNNPTLELAWAYYAIFNAKQENFDKMTISVEEMLNINSNSTIGNILKAYILFKKQKYHECRKILCQMIGICGHIHEIETFIYLLDKLFGNEQIMLNESRSSHETLNFVYSEMELPGLSDEYLLNMKNIFIRHAVFFIKIGCYDIAELCLGEYNAEHGININYLLLLSAIDSSKRNYKDAIKHLERISQSDIGNHQLHYSKIAYLIVLNLLHMKNIEKAKEILDINMLSSCGYFPVLFLFALHYNSIHEHAIARDFLTQALKVDQHHFVYRELGKSCYFLKLFDMAEKALLSALQQEKKDVESWTMLKELYVSQNRHGAAKFCDLNLSIVIK